MEEYHVNPIKFHGIFQSFLIQSDTIGIFPLLWVIIR